MQRARDQEREIMVAVDALKAKLGSISKRCGLLPTTQARTALFDCCNM